jgi:glutamate N-acetyltransferase/amino-acid N-acetyltransferase
VTSGSGATICAITAPRGFRAAAVAAGIKPSGLDLALLAAERPCSAAAVFTTNRAQAAPVLVSREHLHAGRARAVVINAGCANAATGEPGIADARATAATVAALLSCEPHEIVVASTGVIGTRLPMDKLQAGLGLLVPALAEDGGGDAARAILTTDTHPKEALVEFAAFGETFKIGAMAKGAGMIAPQMATLLAFFTTDAAVEPCLLRAALAEATDATLNRITVDGDTSTNDMALLLASGAAAPRAIDGAGPEYTAFKQALTEAARRVALLIVRDGEGATRTAEIRVEGAAGPYVADRVARAVAESALVKTALHGGDPNWGRILAAAGRAGVDLDIGKIEIHLGDVWVCEGGCAREYEEAEAHAAVTQDLVRIRIVLHQGTASGSIWTCDFSRDYVDINAHYRS